MTVSTSINSVVYRGNGAATQFAVPFKVLDEGHLLVRRRVFATGTIDYTYVGTDYSYTGIGASSGTLTLAGTALDDDYELLIERIVPYTQELDIVNAGGFYPETVEEQLDLMAMSDQQLADLAGRGLVVPVGEDGLTVPKLASRVGKYLAFDADGGLTAATGGAGDSGLRTDLASTDGASLVGTDVGSSVQLELDALRANRALVADLDAEEAARIAADAALDTRVDTLEGTVTSGRLAYATWAELDAVVGTAGQVAEVPTSDTGTHTDPVVGGTVDNSGIFRYDDSPAGWERLYDTDAASAEPFATAAAASAADAATSETNAAASEAAAAASAASVAGLIGDGSINELPASPVEGQIERWAPTGEVIHWDSAQGLWLRDNGKPLANIVMRFDGEAGQAVDSYYEAEYSRLNRDFEARISPVRVSNAAWAECNGDGTASFNGDNSSSTSHLSGSMMFPLGCDDCEGYMIVTPGADVNGNPGFYVSDGNTSALIEIDVTTSELRIADHIQGDSSPEVRQNKVIAGYNSALPQTIGFRFDDHVVTAWIGATEIKAVSKLGSKHLGAFRSRRQVSEFGELVVYPRDMNGGVRTGDSVYLGTRGLVGLPDCDALNGLDMGDHALFAVVTSTNVATGAAQVQGPAKIQLFKRSKIDGAITFLAEVDTNTDNVTSDRITKIEGICIFLIGGVVHIAAADQGAHRIMLYRAPSPSNLAAESLWPRVQLNTQTTYNAQTVEAIDLGDGYVRLFCTYEGHSSSTGGVLSWRFNGGNSLTQGNWTEVFQVAAPGAWGTLKGQKIVDLFGDGRRIFPIGCRGGATAFRNVDGSAGIFYFDVDEGSIDTGGKTLETIQSIGEDTLMIDLANLGGGHGMDLSYTHYGAGVVNFLERDAAWTKTTVAMPVTTDPYPWNLWWDAPSLRNGRSVHYVVMGESANGGLYVVSHDGSAFTYERQDGITGSVQRMAYGHPFDKSVLYRFEMLNGLYEWTGGDSGGNHGRAPMFQKPDAAVPLAAPAIVTSYETEAEDLFDAWSTLTVPATDDRKEIENEFIAEAIDCGAWALIGALWIPAAHAAAAGYVNWKDPANYTLAPTGAPTFTVDEGIQGDGVDDYYDPSLDLTVTSLGISQNDICAGSVRTLDSGSTPDIGSANGALWMQARTTANGGGRLSRTTSIATLGASNGVLPVPYHIHGQRTLASGAGAETFDANGDQKQTSTNASTALPNNIYLLRSSTTYSAARIGAAYIGQALISTTMRQRFSLALMRRMAKVRGL